MNLISLYLFVFRFTKVNVILIQSDTHNQML